MKRCHGFTLIELLVVLGIIVLLLGLLVPSLSQARQAARNVVCLNQLRQINGALFAYADDHQGLAPPEADSMFWDDLLIGYAEQADLFICPSDPHTDGDPMAMSYGFRDAFETDDPRCSIAGRRIRSITDSTLVTVFEIDSDWHAASARNAGAIDGSARGYPDAEFYYNLAKPAR